MCVAARYRFPEKKFNMKLIARTPGTPGRESLKIAFPGALAVQNLIHVAENYNNIKG